MEHQFKKQRQNAETISHKTYTSNMQRLTISNISFNITLLVLLYLFVLWKNSGIVCCKTASTVKINIKSSERLKYLPVNSAIDKSSGFGGAIYQSRIMISFFCKLQLNKITTQQSFLA